MYATFWALVPPIVAILLALITKEVYISLFIGIIFGGFFIEGFNHPVAAVETVFRDGIIGVLPQFPPAGLVQQQVVALDQRDWPRHPQRALHRVVQRAVVYRPWAVLPRRHPVKGLTQLLEVEGLRRALDAGHGDGLAAPHGGVALKVRLPPVEAVHADDHDLPVRGGGRLIYKVGDCVVRLIQYPKCRDGSEDRCGQHRRADAFDGRGEFHAASLYSSRI